VRTAYRFWITLLWLAVIAQIAGAAYGAFYSAQKLGDQSGPDEQRMISEKVFDHGFGFHTGFGYLIFLAGIVLLLIALGAKLGKRGVLLALGVPLLVALQIVLAWASESVHAIGILHGLNALVIFGYTGWLTGQAWRAKRAERSTQPVASPAA
jgi:hypothetical protein